MQPFGTSMTTALLLFYQPKTCEKFINLESRTGALNIKGAYLFANLSVIYLALAAYGSFANNTFIIKKNILTLFTQKAYEI